MELLREVDTPKLPNTYPIALPERILVVCFEQIGGGVNFDAGLGRGSPASSALSVYRLTKTDQGF